MKLLSKVLFLLIFSFSFTFELTFSQVISTELKNKVENSDMIVTGKVINQKSQWNSDKSRIYTLVTIRVEELLKGTDYQSEIIIKHLGGEIGNVGEVYSHVPSFNDNEDVLVFVKKSVKDGSLLIYGGDEGKYSFQDNSIFNEKQTSNNIKVSELKKEIRRFVKQ